MKIYFFGDSIAFGQYISIHKTWVSKISKQLETDFPDQDIIVNNPSISGNTTRQALERMSYDVLCHRPDILYIQFGLNDCNIWETDCGSPRVSLSSYLANLYEMVERSYAAGIKKVLINTNHSTSKKADYNSNNTHYYEGLVGFKFKRDCAFLDIRNHIEHTLKINDPRQYLLNDGIHLNKEGHGIYFEYLIDPIRAIVESVK